MTNAEQHRQMILNSQLLADALSDILGPKLDRVSTLMSAILDFADRRICLAALDVAKGLKPKLTAISALLELTETTSYMPTDFDYVVANRSGIRFLKGNRTVGRANWCKEISDILVTIKNNNELSFDDLVRVSSRIASFAINQAKINGTYKPESTSELLDISGADLSSCKQIIASMLEDVRSDDLNGIILFSGGSAKLFPNHESFSFRTIKIKPSFYSETRTLEQIVFKEASSREHKNIFSGGIARIFPNLLYSRINKTLHDLDEDTISEGENIARRIQLEHGIQIRTAGIEPNQHISAKGIFSDSEMESVERYGKNFPFMFSFFKEASRQADGYSAKIADREIEIELKSLLASHIKDGLYSLNDIFYDRQLAIYALRPTSSLVFTPLMIRALTLDFSKYAGAVLALQARTAYDWLTQSEQRDFKTIFSNEIENLKREVPSTPVFGKSNIALESITRTAFQNAVFQYALWRKNPSSSNMNESKILFIQKIFDIRRDRPTTPRRT